MSCNTFTLQVMSPKQVMLGTLILGLSFLQASCPPQQRDSSSTSSIGDSKDSGHQLERKRHFLLVTPIAKPFTFVFDCSGKINLPSNRKSQARTSPTFFCFLLLINRSHEPDTPTKFLACYFRREPFLVSRCILLSSPFKFTLA